MKSIVGLIVFAATLASAQQTQVQLDSVNKPDELPFSPLEVGVDSPLKKSGVKIIKNEDEWTAFLTKMNELTQKRSKIDWTKNEVVVATLEGSTNSGITLHVTRLHMGKNGKTDIEIAVDPQIGNSRLINTTNSDNYLGNKQYPYAIFQTPITSTKWNIKVSE